MGKNENNLKHQIYKNKKATVKHRKTEEVRAFFLVLNLVLCLQTNELYQLAAVAFCLIVAWVCPLILSLWHLDNI